MTKLNQIPACSKPLLYSRIFKFRAWIISQKKMIKVFGFNEHLIFEQTWDSPMIKENIFEIKDCHIMQFTGLKDKNGIEVYEGDIAIFSEEVCEIKWNDDFCGFTLNGKDKTISYWSIKDCTVIGNIYEVNKIDNILDKKAKKVLKEVTEKMSTWKWDNDKEI